MSDQPSPLLGGVSVESEEILLDLKWPCRTGSSKYQLPLLEIGTGEGDSD